MSETHLEFAMALHRSCTKGKELDNFVWSPYSVASSLGLAAQGAAGGTRQELVRAIAGNDHGLTDLVEACRQAADLAAPQTGTAASGEVSDAEPAISPYSGASNPAQIALLNGLWLRQDIRIKDDFSTATRAWPGGMVQSVDFRSHPTRRRAEINSIVEETTQGLVPNLIQPNQITADTMSVLANALWLRASWYPQFPSDETRPNDFHTPGGARPTPMMHREGRMPYVVGDGWRMVSLSTSDNAISVDIVLPTKNDLVDVENNLNAAKLIEARKLAKSALVDLRLPRFRIRGQAELLRGLFDQGIRSAFGDNADFSLITSSEPLKIDTVAHQAVLTVDEHGLEGAAATAMMMVRAGQVVRPEPIPFHVDQPFLVIVWHRETGLIYFLARVIEP